MWRYILGRFSVQNGLICQSNEKQKSYSAAKQHIVLMKEVTKTKRKLSHFATFSFLLYE